MTAAAATNGQGTVTYALQSQPSGNYFSFNTSTRVLTMAASTPAGTYSVVIRATAAGNGNYNSGTKDSTITVTVGRASVGAKPTTSVEKTYTGSSQTNGYTTPSYVTVSGSTSGTNVGNYVATYTPDSNHKWSDGTTAAVSVTLTIKAATLTLTPTAYSAAWDGSAHSASIKSNVASTTVDYGTSTSYGTSVTVGTTAVTMSAVTRTAVGTTTVYYKGSKTNYTSPTGSTTITITRASVGAKPGTTISKVYNGSSQTNGYTTPSYVTVSGSTSGTTVGDYAATYTPDSNHM